MVAIGAGLAVRRAALAHIVYNVTIGILGICLAQTARRSRSWVGSQLDDPHGVLALAAFSSIFKFVGVAAFYPWLDGFSRFIVRISGRGAESAVSRLEPALAEAGGAVALEAAWRAILEIAHGSVDAVRRRLAGESVSYDPPVEAVRQIEHFLELLSLETTDLGTFEPRLVRLCHALDHLTQLHDDLADIPPAVSGWQPPAGFDGGCAGACGVARFATKDPAAAPDPGDLRARSKPPRRQLADERKTGREKILEDVALQRTPRRIRPAPDLDSARSGPTAPFITHGVWPNCCRIASGKQPTGRSKTHLSGRTSVSTVKQPMKRKEYEKAAAQAAGASCARLQDWVKHKGLRVIVVFEGRDAAGKGGTIKAITERVSPRVFRVVALPAPSDREKSQLYMQRYMPHFPPAGEIVIFDRSWYNRAGVEYVMGFCTEEQHRRFLQVCPEFEKYIVDGGILLIKFWLEVSDEEQKRRFEARIEDPLRQWKLSPMDLVLAQPMVRVFAGARHDVRGHRHEIRSLVHRPLRRQAARAPQLHPPPARPHSLRKGAAEEGEAPRPLDERRL